MQFGIFTVGDITTDPATGKAPSEHQRIKNTVEMAVLAEQAGLDFFATGEHHNPPFAPSSPTTLLQQSIPHGWCYSVMERLWMI